VALELREDEIAYLDTPRCEACGHLESVHNDHCCAFCMVDDCACEWGEMPADV
jgi:hypothetical protein